MTGSESEDAWIGRRIGRLRREHDWTLAELAVKVDLSATQLSRIESGARHSSVGTLIELARAFDMPLSELVAEHDRSPFQVVRAPDRTARETASGVLAPLSGDYPGLQALQLTIHASTQAPAAQHRGEEWLYVLTGTVEVTIGAATVSLGPGDAVHFQANVPHRVHNTAEDTAEILLVAAPAKHA